MSNTTEKPGQGATVADQAQNCRPAPKWAALVNDQVVPMPQRHVKASVIREQGGVPYEHILLRDHNSPHDPVIPENSMVDLAEGNVFYSEPACDVKSRPPCDAPPKLAYAVDDRWEVVIRPGQTGRTVRDLFRLPAEVELLRDYESPLDQIVGDDDAANFGDGPVFRTRKRHEQLMITVNKKRFTIADGVKPQMTGREIASLVFPDPDRTSVFKVEGETDKPIGLDEKIKIANHDDFKVIRNDVVAGFQATRVEREVTLLRDGGAGVTLLTSPVAAVIYHDVPTRNGLPVAKTDVLVKIPGGYPASFLDNAYLPAGSPLLGKVPGAVQGTETLGAQSWRLISIHPHHPKGTAWNKDRHGLHTYYDEILSWLNKRP
ncbi:MAG: hypothetical protein PCFJNLEI_01108 [Verrucomicrobiae bacterium]|nr:hypothetical protein [Verrucomicrobiae bacterium]